MLLGLIDGKDNASRVQRQDEETKFHQAWHCRAAAYLLQR